MQRRKELANRLASKYPALSTHHLYEASVQAVECDIDFIDKVWRKLRSGQPETLREDFCGTASLCAEWVRRDESRRAWGVDLDGETLAWGLEHRVGLLGSSAKRVQLDLLDVRVAKTPLVQVQVAFNFSYFIFHTREALLGYFRAVHQSLDPSGLFLMDLFGGIESEQELEEETKYEAQIDPDGTHIPAFTYIWDQRRFNAIDRALRCYIHFELEGGLKLRKVFRYDWRFWLMVELREILAEAGFARSHVYSEGWDDDSDEPDGRFRKKKRLENEGGYVAYIVAERSA